MLVDHKVEEGEASEGGGPGGLKDFNIDILIVSHVAHPHSHRLRSDGCGLALNASLVNGGEQGVRASGEKLGFALLLDDEELEMEERLRVGVQADDLL